MAFGRILVLSAIAVLVTGVAKHDGPSKTPLAAPKIRIFRGPVNRTFGDHIVHGVLQTQSRSPYGGNPYSQHTTTTTRKKTDNLSMLHKLNRQHQQKLDGQGNISFTDKMMILREKPKYLYIEETVSIPHTTGVFCSFELEQNSTQDECHWTWNRTVSARGLGFKVITPQDVVKLNSTIRGIMFSGPETDADYNENGHFLYLPIEPGMESMAVSSPILNGALEFCKFEVELYQGGLQNATIRLLSEAKLSGLQLILAEMLGNDWEEWRTWRFTIGRVNQPITVLMEITRPSFVSLIKPLPYIAIDNIRLIDCVPETPVINEKCFDHQLKCDVLGKRSCVRLQQICDLVYDCDNGKDEENCGKMPYGSYCNFEADDCGFEDIPQTVLKWARHHGPTPTDKTGPNYDHTCGPPPESMTTVAPEDDVPLAPAHMNNTDKQCIGYYFFVNMNVTGPNNQRADFASTAMMRSQIFNPPPKVHGDPMSVYYNCCMVRFYYQQNGRNYGSLSVEMVEITPHGNLSSLLWFSTKDKGEVWYRASIVIPYVTHKYFIEFKTRMGMRIYSDSAIDDFSMSPECFGLNLPKSALVDYNYYDPLIFEPAKRKPNPAFLDKPFYRFTPCNATGRLGPTQQMCDVYYNSTFYNNTVKVKVKVSSEGIQEWEVPAEGLYTIIVMGASGGFGSAWAGTSHGAQVRGLFELHKGEKLHMLIGQKGTDACKKTLSAQEAVECSIKAFRNETAVYTSKTHEIRNTEIYDGGGGGGGGTFVFVYDVNGTQNVLLAAGGGGGISVGAFKDDGSQHGKPWTNVTPSSGLMVGERGKTAGAGGGWMDDLVILDDKVDVVKGAAVSEGAKGGSACRGPAHGGFGGGGGGCLKGGGGGGWVGGNTNGGGSHGGGGWSYIDYDRAIKDFSNVSIALRNGPGEVIIIPAIHDCNCDYRCVAMDEIRSEVQCYCPTSWISHSQDATKCILPTVTPIRGFLDKESPRLYILLIASITACCSIMICTCLFFYNAYQRKREADLRSKQLEQEVQLHRLRNVSAMSDTGTVEINPYYRMDDAFFQGMDAQSLPKVSRESLTLLRALGQGAFGEVYEGLYKHREESLEMTVAVKTLPEMSTGQAESDFLMEAAIMAKFNHPNIVHLIGVCFDRHPRFIVLELLGGGDLKCFLRDNRPRPGQHSAINTRDLLICALDVCKGCRYMETKRFIHRDIAARNCLLTSRGPGRVAKIADFGMARDIYRSDYYKKDGKAMLPIKWMPPESFIDGIFTGKTDVWSFGVLLWEVFSMGVMPYTGCSNREVMLLVSEGGRLDKPSGCPQDVYQLMCECWNPSPEERPSFAEMCERLLYLLQHITLSDASKHRCSESEADYLLPRATPVQVSSDEDEDAPLPDMMRNGFPVSDPRSEPAVIGVQRPPSDYLVPTAQDTELSSTQLSPPEPKNPLNKSPQGSLLSSWSPPLEVSPSLAPSKALLEYGNIPIWRTRVRPLDYSAVAAPRSLHHKYQPSRSNDRFVVGLVKGDSDDGVEASQPVYLETSFCRPSSSDEESPRKHKSASIDGSKNSRPASPSTPTTPKQRETYLLKTTDKLTPIIRDNTNQINKTGAIPKAERVDASQPITNETKQMRSTGAIRKTVCINNSQPNITVITNRKHSARKRAFRKDNSISNMDNANRRYNLAEESEHSATIALPEPTTYTLPSAQQQSSLILDPAQLQPNLINKDSVDLHSMSIQSPYINVVSPTQHYREPKKIRHDYRKTVSYEMRNPEEIITMKPKKERNRLEQSYSTNTITERKYAESDTTGSSSGNYAQKEREARTRRNIRYQKETAKQGILARQGSSDTEIHC